MADPLEDQTDTADSGELDTTKYWQWGSNDPLNEQKGVGSGRSYASVGVDASTLSDPTKFDWSKVGDWAKSIFTGQGSIADYGTLLTGAMGLYEYLNKDRSPKTWQGTLSKGTYVPPTVSPQYYSGIMSRGYGERAMGVNPFTGGRYIAPTEAQVYGAPPAPTPAPPPPPTAQSAIEALYQKYAGKAPGDIDAAGMQFWLNKFGDSISPEEEAMFKAEVDRLNQQAAAPVKSAIETLYQRYANKAPSDIDPEGLAYWTNKFGESVSPEEETAFKAEVDRRNALSSKTTTSTSDTSGKQTDTQLFPRITDSKIREFLSSPAFAEYQNTIGSGPGTMDVYDSPYFGSLGSGSKGIALDSAYEAWHQQKYGVPPSGGASSTNKPIQELYAKYANKTADPEGLAYWTNKFGTSVSPEEEAAFKAEVDRLHAMGIYAEGGAVGLAKGGALPPRYLRGDTDGMADQLPSSIDGRQPAKLSHGEFVVPADVVSHLGNGNSDAGAKVLYKMMDRVRQARTGNKRQGKQIQPEKFMPGGIANIPRYSGGGAVAFADGGTTTAGTSAGGLAPWVGDYIAGPEGFLSKAWALGDKPYQAYQGPLTAGISPAQQKGITAAQTLGTPSQFGTATSLAERAGQAAGNISYTPGTFGAQGVTATGVTSGYQAPGAYQTGQFSTGLGPVGSVQSYMSPYMQGVVDIQAREARRQADIGRQAEQARLAQAGAYGGSRQAIMEAERQRNLGQQIGDIQEKGLQSAYDRALQQRMQESQLGLQAQQFGEQSRQYGYGQQMTAAQLQAQYGLDAQKANQIANLQAQQANQRAALEAQQMGEQSRQFGANLGLQGLQQQLSAAQILGGLGQQQFGTQLQGIDALMRAGSVEQQAEQQAVDAQLRQFQEAQQWPYKQLEFQRSLLSGLPVATQTMTPTTSGFSDLIGGIGSLLKLRELLGG